MYILCCSGDATLGSGQLNFDPLGVPVGPLPRAPLSRFGSHGRKAKHQKANGAWLTRVCLQKVLSCGPLSSLVIPRNEKAGGRLLDSNRGQLASEAYNVDNT